MAIKYDKILKLMLFFILLLFTVRTRFLQTSPRIFLVRSIINRSVKITVITLSIPLQKMRFSLNGVLHGGLHDGVEAKAVVDFVHREVHPR